MALTKKIKRIDGWLHSEEHHRTVMKDYVTKRSICDEPKCKFYGQLSEQGVCHSVIPDKRSAYYEKLLENAEQHLAFNRQHNYKKLSQKQIIKSMESEIVCHFMNWCSCLDELIWLRGENAKLRGKLGLFNKT